MLQLKAEMFHRMYDHEVQLSVGGGWVQMQQLYEDQEIFMVNTLMSADAGGDDYLIMRYINVNKRSPEFTTP